MKKVKNSVDAWNRHNLNSAFLKSGRIAQLVEQRTENPCVPSSILGPATTIEGVSKEAALCIRYFLNKKIEEILVYIN